MKDPVVLQAILGKCQTMADKSWRISFDAGEDMDDCVNALRRLKDEPLYVVVMTEDQYLRQRGKQ